MNITQEDIDAISLAIRDILSPELALIETQMNLLRDMYKLLGLETNNPLITTIISKTVDEIYQSIVTDDINKCTTIARVN